MSQDQAEQDRTFWTGDRENYKERQQAYLDALSNSDQAAPETVVALAIRAGLSELAVEVSSIRGFGVNQAAGRKP